MCVFVFQITACADYVWKGLNFKHTTQVLHFTKKEENEEERRKWIVDRVVSIYIEACIVVKEVVEMVDGGAKWWGGMMVEGGIYRAVESV